MWLVFVQQKETNVFRKNYPTDGHCVLKARFLVPGALRESSRKLCDGKTKSYGSSAGSMM
jgi:hypothetical protein